MDLNQLKENKPKRPVMFYYAIAFVVLLLLNLIQFVMLVFVLVLSRMLLFLVVKEFMLLMLSN